ncbi:MAG TPA: DUF417 family protein [Phycisphaerae bacterium]|nr:DUF417 family protein [Phycisphaerae bacterium]HRW51540.1 DUF417 family protein [Phycisphaerae bacterium]
MNDTSAQQRPLPPELNVESHRSMIVGLEHLADPLARIGRHARRISLVIIIGWIGAMKFTSYEAEGISGLVANSPLMGWWYNFLTHEQFSALLGVAEIVIAALIAAGAWSRRAGAFGAVAAVGMFLTTLSFMLSTPGVAEPTAGGFPAISAMPGQFLVKDLALLAISVSLLAEALRPWNAPVTRSA